MANCLPPLIPSVKEEAPGFVNKLLHQLLKSDKYGDRKGAAYGLAGLVKGMGILALKQLDIMTKLTDAIQDKKNYKHREGIEILQFSFKRLFLRFLYYQLSFSNASSLFEIAPISSTFKHLIIIPYFESIKSLN